MVLGLESLHGWGKLIPVHGAESKEAIHTMNTSHIYPINFVPFNVVTSKQSIDRDH